MGDAGRGAALALTHQDLSMNPILQRAVFAAALLLGVAPHAIAERLPAKLFAQHPQFSSVAMSPDGKHLAITTPVDDRTDLMIVDLTGKNEPKRIRYMPKEHVINPYWADDDRLVVGKGKTLGFLEQPFSLGELYSTNLEMKEQKLLFGYQNDVGNRRGRQKDQGYASVIKRVGGAKGEMLVQFQSWSELDKKTYVYKVNATTGSRDLIEKLDLEGAGISVDRDGTPRFAVSVDEHFNPIMKYRPKPDSEWVAVPSTLAGRSMSVWSFDKDNNIAWAEISDKGEPEVMYRVDFANGTRTKVFERGEYDTGGIMYAGFDNEPLAFYSSLPKPSIQYLDASSDWAKLHAGLMKQFAGSLVNFAAFSRDDQVVLVRVASDRNPGTYYLLDRKKNSIAKILDSYQGLDAAKLAPMRPMEFKNRDGMTLSAMLTLPIEGQAPFPMVVLPHGGPHGVSDSWSFDSDVQFLANRGYAVLQVNFRGSGDRGETFQNSTHRKWGGAIMDDIADGLKWAVEQNFANKDKVCIYGVSFGGYAALMNPIRYPDAYKCAIGYAGFYDMEMDYKKGDVNDSRRGRNQIAAELGTDTEEMRRNSPARQPEKVKIPVMLVHGKDDQRCPYAHYKMMLDGLERSGSPVTSLVKDAEAHGFYKEENRIELYEKMEAFLDKHIGAKSQ